MASRRTVIIAAAVVLAIVGGLANYAYLHGADQRAQKNATLVQVYVVKKAIPKGLPGGQAISQNYVGIGQIPQQFRPGSALSNIDDISGKVAIADLSPGQVVVDGQFVDQAKAQTTFAQSVTPGHVAVSVSLDQVHSVAGLLKPGDWVDMLVLGPDSGGKTKSTVMYQNVHILAIGSQQAPTAGDTSSTKTGTTGTPASDAGLITFDVPLEAAQRIVIPATGTNGASLFLTLVPPNNTPVNPPGPVDAQNYLSNLPQTPYPS